MQFKDYFDATDTLGTQHTGFLQSMDFSAITSEVPFINELTMAFMDAHLYNELSGSMVLRQWANYMHYSKANERLEICAQFYADFVKALTAKLTHKQEFWSLKNTDFTSLSATDIKTIEHGTKETDFDYAQAQKTRLYGQDQTTTQYGAQVEQSEYAQRVDSTAYGSGTQTMEYGATETTKGYGSRVQKKDYDKVVVDITHGDDTHVIGLAHSSTSNTTTNKLYPLGASDYVNDTQQIISGTADSDAQTNRDTFGNVKNETAARADKETTQAYTDTETSVLHTDVKRDAEKTDTATHGAHTDVVTDAAHTDTETRATRTDTETDAAKKDTQTVKAYTDTERHTKHIVISPEKYFEIEKELADIGAYDLMLEAVKETMLLSVWREEEFLW